MSPAPDTANLLAVRLKDAIILVFVILTLLFFFIRLVPSRPAVFYENPRITSEQKEILNQALGLDKPLAVQYITWLRDVVVRFDWGYSYTHKRPVKDVLFQHLGPTLLLSATALLIQYGLGILLGVVSARRAGSFRDHLIRGLSLFVYALPGFWLGLMALLALSYGLEIFPSGGTHSPHAAELSGFGKLFDRLHHLALPALVLGVSSAGRVSRFVRTSLVEVLDNDYIRTARAKGLAEGSVIWLHALRNSLTSLTQLAGLSLPFLFGGALVTEVVFSWPGMGRLVWRALDTSDYPLILGATGMTALLVVLGSLLADVLQVVVDPKVRHE